MARVSQLSGETNEKHKRKSQTQKDPKHITVLLIWLRVKQTDVWMHGCLDAWMYGRMDVWMHECMDARMYGCMDVWTQGCRIKHLKGRHAEYGAGQVD